MRNRRAIQEVVWECAIRLLDASSLTPGPERTALFWRLYEGLLVLVETCEATDGRNLGGEPCYP